MSNHGDQQDKLVLLNEIVSTVISQSQSMFDHSLGKQWICNKTWEIEKASLNPESVLVASTICLLLVQKAIIG